MLEHLPLAGLSIGKRLQDVLRPDVHERVLGKTELDYGNGSCRYDSRFGGMNATAQIAAIASTATTARATGSPVEASGHAHQHTTPSTRRPIAPMPIMTATGAAAPSRHPATRLARTAIAINPTAFLPAPTGAGMNLLRRNPKDAPAGGLIACAGLAAWWSATFTPQEQQRIIASFGKSGAERGEALVNGSFPCSGTYTRQMLSLMASGLTDTPSRSMARRMMEKADSLPPEDIFGKHATLGVMIQLY